MHDHDGGLWETMVVCVEEPDSDRGDFRRWHAVNISSLIQHPL